MNAIVEAVLGCDELDDPRWHELSMIFSTTRGGRNFGNSGYAYGDMSAWWAVALPVLTVKPAVLAYLDAVLGSVPETLCRVLLKYNRVNGRVRIEVERHNPQRWDITPGNARSMQASLRPGFW
ncbi:hypothetical protein LQ948_18735 [Jiella sp. MQZ9-1]|uniref:Uncharacterized protein n=1 Tax=Jiella flava TaxID=2816857 RepID=A0A939G2Y7_9HYPH|nr:hypothetical protein [Jiella flava]MCD2473226.1 hypothetical protein [Jiella flava]